MKPNVRSRVVLATCILATALFGGQTKNAALDGPAPTFPDVKYGPHERNVLDFWKAESATPSPVIVFIHGGGFRGGDKSGYRKRDQLQPFLSAGVSCAAINYRFLTHAPIQDILHDAGRAIQFIRSKAGEWNVDKTRLAAWGGSAGAGTSLWLDTREDLADAKNADPVLRESSRVSCAVLTSTQATYDLTKWDAFLGKPKSEWVREEETYGFYHFKSKAELETDAGKAVLAECDMLHWITKDDGPIFIVQNGNAAPPADLGQYLHHAKHADEIKKACDEAGVKCEVRHGGAGMEPIKFVLEQFKAGKQ
ncbi:MAG TPA: alpha/beta hydrolase [Planctomycetota bacterium]